MLKIIALILNIFKFDYHRDYKVGKVQNTKFIYRLADEEDIYYYGMSVACSACYYLLKNIPFCILIFDNDFEEFDDEEKEFIIFHELGHVNLHFKTHNYENYNIDRMSDDEKILIEHEADMYGVEHTSYKAAIKTMQKLIVMFNDVDIKKRLRLIKNKLN